MIDEVDNAFKDKFGEPIFRKHEHVSEISARIHRFRSLEKRGLFELAKDVTRLTADLIDVDALKRALELKSGDKRGSLKLLEALIAKDVRDDAARQVMGAMFGAYELRLADAHLPKSELESAFKLLGIVDSDTPLNKGLALIHSIVSAWSTVALALRGEAPDHVRRHD